MQNKERTAFEAQFNGYQSIGYAPNIRAVLRIAFNIDSNRRGIGILIEPLSNAFGKLKVWGNSAHWILFYGLVLLTWIGLFSTIIPFAEWSSLGVYGWDLFFALCSIDPRTAGPALLLGMWLLMAAAMMLPTIVPALRVYDGLRTAGAGSRSGFLVLTSGYIFVWFGYACVMTVFQLGAREAIDEWLPASARTEVYFAALVLSAAGFYQFTPLKEACLRRCRNPMTFFMAHWREGWFAELWIGAKLGVVCLGCCWLLMAFSLVSGTMSVLWMGLATLVMTVEKLRLTGRFVTVPLGLILIAGAACVMVFGGPA